MTQPIGFRLPLGALLLANVAEAFSDGIYFIRWESDKHVIGSTNKDLEIRCNDVSMALGTAPPSQAS